MTKSSVLQGITNLWLTRTPAERRTLRLGGLLLLAIGYLWFVYTGTLAREVTRSNVAMLQAQMTGMEQDGLELERLRALPAPAASATELDVLLETAIANAGLSGTLLRLDKLDADHVALAFGAVPFTDWLAWIVNMEGHGIRVDSSRIEALTTPGLVSVTATLQRSSVR